MTHLVRYALLLRKRVRDAQLARVDQLPERFSEVQRERVHHRL